MDLPGRVALLTGTKRIGAVVAIELARRGADVGLVYFSSRAECDEAAAAIRALGRRAAVLQANLRDPEACRRVADETVTAFGRLDVQRITPLGRWGGEIEIAKAVLALIDTDYMTGETIRVDGGRHVK